MNRVLDKIRAGQTVFGVQLKGAPHLVATLANAGFDFVRPDLMFSGMDWREVDHVLRAAEAKGIGAMIRVPSNPWFGGTESLQVTVDAGRAFSLGAQAVQVSVASAAQVAALLQVARDWHRSAAGDYPASEEGLEKQKLAILEEAILVPSIESKSALDDLDEIMALDGLRCVFIAATDLASEVGHPMDYEHPDVWTAVDTIIGAAAARDIIVFANTGFTYTATADIARRVAALRAHGVGGIMLQSAEFLLERLSADLLLRLT